MHFDVGARGELLSSCFELGVNIAVAEVDGIGEHRIKLPAILEEAGGTSINSSREGDVRLLGMTQDLSAPAPIARYQTPHLNQNCRSYDFRYYVGFPLY